MISVEATSAELMLRLRQQELVAGFSAFSLRTDDLPPVLDEACRVAAEGLRCPLAKVLRHNPEDGAFLVVAGIGWHEGVVGHARLRDGDGSGAGEAFRTGRPVMANDLAGETRFDRPSLLVEHGVALSFNVLIRLPDGLYGVLEVDARDREAFSPSDTAFLEGLASTLGSAIAKHGRMRELRASKVLVEEILEASPDCIKLIGLDGRLLSINANGLVMLGVTDARQIEGRPWEALWPEDQRERVRAALATASAGGIGRFDGMCPTLAGTPRWWDVLVAPLNEGASKPRRLVSISRDISERMALVEAKDLLMLEVHHRVKNSLQLVQNLLSLQGRATGDEIAREQMMQSAARVRTIGAIHDRLYATGSALTVEVRPYLEALIHDLREGLVSTIHGRGMTVSVAPVTWLASDMPTLGLVLTELVTNAIKYGAGDIGVIFEQPAGEQPDGGYGTLIVSDEGHGPPPDFDPSRSRGLGMRLVTGLLRGEGGGLEIERRAGRTAFIARMPRPRGIAT